MTLLRTIAVCSLTIAFAPAIVSAQPAQSAQQQHQQATGLDALTDDKLIADLANRGLTNLLNRAYDVNNVPPAQRGAMQPVLLVKKLADPKLTLRQRDELIPQIVKGIDAALPALSDPQQLNNLADELRKYGVEREVSLLEYWGESARSQVPLRPTVETIIRLLDKAADIAQKQADAMANAIQGPNDPRAAKWEQLATVAAQAKYTRHMLDYYLALSMDRVAAAAQRKDVAAKAIEYLAQFDNPESGVQPRLRIQLGKLRMVRDEFDQAKEIFATVIAGQEIEPKPDVWQQWEARYFSAVCDLLRGDAAAAQKGLNDLIAWQQATLPKDKQSQDQVVAAAAMLQYRIHSLLADKAATPAAAAKANEQAVTVLLDLVNKRPDLRSVIFRQLISKLPPKVDLKTLDPLLLQGIVVRADEERLRAESEKVDAAVIQRGVDAIREILRRRKDAAAKIDAQTADADALLLGFLLERIGQRPAAVEAFLDYIRDFGGGVGGANLKNATLALDNALFIVGQLRANEATANDPATLKAYERVLPVAINPPFNRREFAYDYARLLQTTDKPAEALKYFRQVPESDRRYASARYYEMVALQQRLDEEKLPEAERKQVVAEVLRMVDDVSKQLTAAMNAAPNDAERTRYRALLVNTTLLAADVARREQNDPKRTLALLENFEQVSQGLPNQQELIGSVLYTRVQSFMQLGNSDAATRTLVALLKSKPGGEGASIVYNLLQKLNAELDAARLAGNVERMQVLARNRALLSGFLVEWARNNEDPNIRKFTYKYSVFDADTKHLAASLEQDAAARQDGLRQALDLYRKLESPESVELYRATLEASSPERNYPDPAVTLGIGLIAYDLGDFTEAQRRLGRLLTDRKLGTPTVAQADESGQTKIVENDQYWEATLKLMRSNLALAAANPNDATAQAAKAETISYLKQLYVRWGRDVGGKRWSPEFEKLRAEMIPDFDPNTLAVETPTTVPETGAAQTQ
jgi:hypothetical protein